MQNGVDTVQASLSHAMHQIGIQLPSSLPDHLRQMVQDMQQAAGHISAELSKMQQASSQDPIAEPAQAPMEVETHQNTAAGDVHANGADQVPRSPPPAPVSIPIATPRATPLATPAATPAVTPATTPRLRTTSLQQRRSRVQSVATPCDPDRSRSPLRDAQPAGEGATSSCSAAPPNGQMNSVNGKPASPQDGGGTATPVGSCP